MERTQALRVALRRLLAFPMLREAAGRPSVSPSEGELLYQLAGQNPGNLLFGRFDPEEVRKRMARAGILEGLKGRGYPDPQLLLECEDPADQRVYLFAGASSRDRLLLEARLELRIFHPRNAIGPFTQESAFRILIIHWLGLSDPDRPFSPLRPRLPGQQRPGLGLLPQSLALLRDLGRELVLDGVLDVPDHFHTAVFYSRAFRFLDPEVEGRMHALSRDFSGIPLALVSEAVKLGCLVRADTAEPIPWEPAEQVLPICAALRNYFRSHAYRERRDEAGRAFRAAIDWDLYRQKIADAGRAGKSP